MASNAQASERGMASTGATGFEVMMTGAGTAALGVTKSGCVFVMLMAGAGAAGRGNMLMRAVSFFGPRSIEAAVALSSLIGGTGRIASLASSLFSVPGGFGNGCKSGEATEETGGMSG